MKPFISIFLKAIFIASLLIVSQTAISAVSSGQETAAAEEVAKGLPAFFAAKNTQVMLDLVNQNAQAIAATISPGDLQSCSKGDDTACQVVFQAVVRYLEKLLTPEYRMTHAIHLFRANKVQYSRVQAQAIASALLMAKK
jgi:hypothetical protein